VIRQWLVALLVALGVNLLLKQWVKRARPGTGNLLYGHGPDEYSFPSGHAMRMAVLLEWSRTLWPTWGWLTWRLALWVGWSRVYLGINYLGDIVVGLGLGGLIGRTVRRYARIS
jgi:undecaprenyl-diphosphatase